MWDREKKVGNCKNEFYEYEEHTYSKSPKIGDKKEVNKMLYNGNPTLVCASETWAISQDHDGQNCICGYGDDASKYTEHKTKIEVLL